MFTVECVFCKIVTGKISSHTVYEDDDACAFLEINPASEGHVLVIPKKHAGTVFELNEDTFNSLLLTVKHIGSVLQKTFLPKRVGILVYGFDVKHAHVHLIPLYTGEELTLNRRDTSEVKTLEEVAMRIASAM